MRLLCLLGCLAAALARAQTTPTPPSLPPQIPTNAPEMNTSVDNSATFRSHVNLVLVPVVARDAHGAVVGNLTKANFTLYDKGKLQEITRFAVEKVGSKSLEADATAANAGPGDGEAAKSMVVVPERYVAYLFDDVHLNAGDLPRVRDAALRHVATMRPSDRAAIYTMSGFPQVDFTDDRERLKDALMRLRPNLLSAVGAMSGGNPGIGGAGVGGMGGGGAGNIQVEVTTMASLDVIQQLIQRMSGAPGQRIIVMVSPGFFTFNPLYFQNKQQVLDSAVRHNVIINGLDARGLWTDPALDASRSGTGGGGGRLGLNSVTRESMRTDILWELASGTGGQVFQNSNDYDEGFRRLGAAPEYVYMLGFTPQNLKNDGAFHALKVVVKPSNNVNIQARRGYYAPGKKENAEETAKEEISNALYSREELQELPIELHTRFFKPEGNTAKMTVMLKLDLRLFKYNKAYGRNNNTVTMVTGIFDRDGNYVEGIKKVLELHLKDETLNVKLAHGAVIRTDFDLTPGTYLVRQVVRDAEGQEMSATNAAVVIP
ncbi:MAG TPA: VWA domain-containing protein [Bryobacteraceae bacterium]|nr:VWA domain-containing protein [Bryobacteraceae bacterium]